MHATLRATESMARVSQARPGDLPSDEVIPIEKSSTGLTSQTRRAAFSAAANIVEGSAKHGAREYRRFLDISIGSLAELGYAFRVARELEMLSSAHWLTLEDLRRRAGFLTWRLYRSLGNRAR